MVKLGLEHGAASQPPDPHWLSSPLVKLTALRAYTSPFPLSMQGILHLLPTNEAHDSKILRIILDYKFANIMPACIHACISSHPPLGGTCPAVLSRRDSFNTIYTIWKLEVKARPWAHSQVNRPTEFQQCMHRNSFTAVSAACLHKLTMSA